MTRGRRLGVRSRGGPPCAARPAARRRTRRIRPRPQAGGRVGRRRARALPALHAEGRPRARARDRVPPARRRAAHRSRRRSGIWRSSKVRKAAATVRCSTNSIAPITSMGSRLLRSWLLRPLLSLDAIRDRLDARRGPGVPDDRTRQVPGRRQGRAGSRAARRAGSAGHRRSARPGRAETVHRPDSAAPHAARRPAGAARPLARSPNSTTSPTCATGSRRLWSTIRRCSRAKAASRATASTARSTSSRSISRTGKQFIAEMEERERARTGISSLKIRYNRVFGYYIEISKSNLHAVPPDYHRKQTIAGGERFITPALKEYEEKVVGADERIVERELRALRARCAAAWPRKPRASRRPPGPSPRSTCSRPLPRPPPSTTTSSRTCTTATR